MAFGGDLIVLDLEWRKSRHMIYLTGTKQLGTALKYAGNRLYVR